jgi:hypothetical protein
MVQTALRSPTRARSPAPYVRKLIPMPSKPILAVDVDGVISLFGFEEPPDRKVAHFQLIDGMVHCISTAAGERLHRLSELYDLVWATGWEDRANDSLAPLLGLPELPVVGFDGAARFGSAHWKLGPLDEYAGQRALAWVDDSFDDSCFEWAQGRPAPTLLVPTESSFGLEEAQTEALTAWALELDRGQRKTG